MLDNQSKYMMMVIFLFKVFLGLSNWTLEIMLQGSV